MTYCLPARANDTTAALTTGGLEFRTNADIEMLSEDLSISRERIEVRYRFLNRSGTDQHVTVAFPMPEIDYSDANNIEVPNNEADNFLNFRTKVDGRDVAAQLEQKALVGKTDVTARLQALGVPLQPRAKATQTALEALPAQAQQQLLKDEIVRPDDFDAGKGMEHHLAPNWRLRATYYWDQTFPAGRELVVEHSYTPSVGGSVQTGITGPYSTAEERANYTRKFCAEPSFVQAVAAMTRKNGNQPPPQQRVSYVLTTGANWAKPIGDFHLTIDKGKPNSLVSFCETGVVKTGPTRFEVRKTNFKPSRDLDILIIDAPQ
ncbi:DUF4424 domain-containing protein [Rhodopseudomonas sp. BR0G17]|uniref:DUF4424 domain-containing protein n=1 Tax=Rhodopseudomonas sp. BR0G17 TaxID=2269368 RepID=UPI001FEF0E58|nr:DUF4424 domain-containing protein [Rhodopseudomonas sp. BR0G17]